MKTITRHLQSQFASNLRWLALLLPAVIFIPSLAQAASSPDTWVGTTSINFGDANWTGVNNPPLSGDSWVFGVAGTSGTNLNNNLTAANSVAGILFTNGASAFTITNNSITLTGNITNSSTSLETLNFPIAATAVCTFTTATGGGNITLGGNFTGTGGGIAAVGSGTLTLSGANSYTGTTTLTNSATLMLQNASALSTGSALSMAGGTTLSLEANANTTFAPASMAFAGTGTLTYNFYVNNISSGSGNTLILGDFPNTPPSTTDTISLTGGNGYTLQIGANAAGTSAVQSYNPTTWNAGSGTTLSIPGGLTIAYGAAYTMTFGGAGNINLGALTPDGAFAVNVIKNGTGTMTLSGADTAPGTITVNQGTLITSGGITASTSPFKVANVAGQSAAVYQTAGTVAIPVQLQVGSIAGAWGYYNLSGGTINVANGGELDPGGTSAGAGAFGQFDMTAGTLNIGTTATTYFLPNRCTSNNVSSVVNILGGTVTINSGMTDGQYGGYEANWNGGGQTNTTTIGGNATFTSLSMSVKMNWANNPGNVASLNLNGGTFQVLGFAANQNAGAVLNFNGGTLKAGNAATVAGNYLANDGNFLANIASVFVYTNGATLDDNGKTIVIAQPLQAPSGNGVSSIAVSAGGSGYAVPPLVIISGGGGSGATAYAQVNGAGVVTNIVVTCPGNGYSSTPTVTLANNGGTGATIGTVTTIPNVSGGLTKNGLGNLVLTGPNTYTNTTVVNAGRLVLVGSQPGTGSIIVSDSAKLGVALAGSSQMSPTSLTAGTNAGATLEFTVNSTSHAPLTPGTLTFNGANTINIVAGNFVAGNSYPLISSTTAFSGTGTYALGTLPNGVSGNLSSTASTITLNVTAVTNTVWTGLVNGVWDINTTANWTNVGTAGNKYIDGSLVQFDDTGITNYVSGGTVSPGAITVNNTAKNYAIKAVIAGTGGLTKTGTGSLTNTAANTYTGPTVINQGNLVVGAASSLNIGGPNGDNYGPLGNNSAVTLGNDATAVLVLTNAGANYSTQIGSLTGGGTTGGNVNLGTATLTVGGDNTSPAAYAGTISGPGSLIKIGTGTLTLSGVNTYTNATTVSAGTLTYSGSAVASATGPFKIGNVAGATGTMNVNGTSSVTFGAGIGYVGYLTGNGVLNLNGGTFANSGEVQVGGSDTSGLGINGTGTLNLSSGAANLSAFTIARGNNNQNTVSGSVTVSGGTLTDTNDLIVGYAGAGFGKLAITGTGTVNVGTTATKWLHMGEWDFTSSELDITNGNLNLNINTAIKFNTQNSSGTHTINQIGGFVTFYSDFATTVGGTGNLDFQNNSSAATSPVNTYNLNGGTLTVPQIISTAATCTRTFNFNGGILRAAVASTAFMNIGTGGTPRANVRNGGAIIDNNAHAITIVQPLLHSSIAGDNATDGGATFNGTAATTLTGTNTYTGGTTVNGGTLQITSDAQLGAVPATPTVNVTLNGGQLYNNASLPVLSTNRTILLTASGGYLQAGWGPDTFTVNGLITGTGALGINWDAGAVILASTNNYVGDTTIGVAFGTYWNSTAANALLRLGIDNALPYGAGVGNLNFGTSGQNNTATLDLNGHNVQLNGLNGSANAIINNTNAGSYTLTVGNNNASGNYAGVIQNTNSTVALVKTGSGTLTLSGANTYTGNTTITNGTLAISSGGSISNTPNIIVGSGATFDVSGTSFTLGVGQNLKGTGAVVGPMTTVSGSAIYPATSGTAGTLVFNSDLNQGAGGVDYFDLNTIYNTGNDQITVAGNLTLNSSDTIHLNALHGSAALDTNSDYVLFAVANSTSMASIPTLVWDGTAPSNHLNFTLALSASNPNNVVLHYTLTQPPIVTAVANPATLTRNQLTTITATVTPGAGGVSSVTVNLLPLGGASAATLVQSNNSTIYTNTFAVAPTIGAGTNSLAVAATDNTIPALVGTYLINPVVVVQTNQVWNGAGPDYYVDDNTNWTSGAAPGYIGDGMTFAGIINTSPDLDQAYTVSGVTFNANAGGFTLNSAESQSLTLTGNGPIVNNSTNAQTLNVPVVMNAVQTFNMAAGDIDVSQPISGSVGLITVGSGTLNLSGNNTYIGLTSLQGGALAVNGGGVVGTTGQNIEIAPTSGEVASLNVTNGTVNAQRVIIAGITANNSSPGTGVVNQAGGTINSYQWFTVGSGGTSNGVGVFNLSGGILNVESQQMEVGNFAGASGTVNMSGTSAINIWNNNALTLGANNNATNSTFNQNSGTVTLYSDAGYTPGGTGFLALGRAAVSSGTFTYYLNGGTLTVPMIETVAGTSQFYFNGGTLQASKANTSFMTGLSATYVSTNGAIINDGGNAVTISQALVHDPALGGAGDGGFTYNGSSTLTLAGSSTYTGNTTINGGTLQLGSEPVLHMTFDNVSGTTVVNQGSGGSAMNGTLTGTATISANGGRFGNALSIPSGASSAAYVLVSSSVVPLNYNGNWTVGMWLKTTTAGGTYLYQGAGAWASGNQTFYLDNGFATVGSGSHAGGVQNSGGWVAGTAAINDGTWHFVVLTGNGGTRTSYVDGALDTLLTNQWNKADTGTQVRIGGNAAGESDGQVGLGGLIDEVYIYNRALSQAEIQQLYNNNNTQTLPTNTTVNVVSGTLDVGGLSQQIGSLTGSGNVLLDDVAGATGTLTVGNANSTTFGGNITDNSGGGALVKAGSGTLSLLGTGSSYGGGTTVSNGTLLVNGSLTGSGPVTVAAGATLGGLGSISGPVTVYGYLAAGSNSDLGSLTINNNLMLAAGATCSFTLGGTYNSGNDQISMNGVLTNNNVSSIIHISAPGILDTNGDYVLINGFSSLVGGFNSTPVWNVPPANYTNYTVVVSGSQVLLHYSATTAPTAGITLSPPTVSRNQNTLITVTATNGYYPVTGVTVDVSAINPASPLTLNQVGSSKVWTNSIAATAGTSPNTYSLVATITDSGSQTATAGALLTVTLANDVWVGGGSDANFDTNPNWGNSAAPGFLGDSLTFAGIVNTNSYMDNTYSVTSLTFSNNAGSFDITGNGSTLTLTGGSVVDNSTNAQTLNVPVAFAAAGTISANAGNLTLAGTVDNGGNLLTVTGTTNTTISGIVSDTGGLTKTGNGTLTLSANDSYSGPTTVSGGTLSINAAGSVPSTSLATVAAGTLNVAGSLTSAGILTVGSAATNAVLINSGTLLTQSNLLVGNFSNAVGAVYQTGGTVTVNGGGGDVMDVGNVLGAYGYYAAIGGTVTANGMAVGGENNIGTGFNAATTGGNGIMDVNGGTVNDTSWFVMARGQGATNETGVLNVFSGLLTYAGGGIANNWGSGGQIAIINVLGGAVTNTLATVGINLNRSGNATNIGILNLNGGVAQGNAVSGAYGQVNFNGGTLKASVANGAFMTGLGSANIYANGATIDNSGYVITVGQPLQAPSGYGVSSISLSSGGTGYIAPPIVTISGGNGSGATAIAQINPATGTVTNILVTCAGNTYLNTDTLTVTLAGGGGGAAAITPVLTALTGGGLTATGTGVLTLTGANIYSGATVVNNGTVQISTEAQLGAVPGSTVTNITLNGGGLYNNNSTPVLSATRTILLGASGGYLQGGWGPQGQSFVVNGLITGTGGLGINFDAAPIYLNAVNNYHGDTTIGTAFGTYWNNTLANPILALGIDNALPYGAGFGNVVFGTTTNNNTATLNLNGHNAQINGLTGSANAIVDNTVAGTYVLTVGNNNQTSIFGGVIKNTTGKVALTKTGSGSVTLSGANSYSGNTTVSGGTLSITQATLATNSTVTVAGGAFLNLGFSSVTNTVAGLVTNGVSAGPGVYNSTTGSPFITGAGSLLVPSTMASNPTNITASVSGNTLTLSWPADHLGWILQSQTNSLTIGLSTNWVDVAGSGSSNTNVITINPALPTAFYRLRHP